MAQNLDSSSPTFSVSSHARERFLERARGWLLAGDPLDAARRAWSGGVHLPWRGDQERVLHEGMVWVFVREGDLVTLITLFPLVGR